MIEKVINRKNMLKAYHQVLSNKGAAGVDGRGVKALSAHLKENGQQIVESVRAGSYLPQPILGVEIPKANGKKRLLGIPTVSERWLQQAVHQVIAPLFEQEFTAHSYGFRPARNAGQAVLQAQKYIEEGYSAILDIDLQNFFDEVDHCLLLQLLYRKVKCPPTLRLIRKWLRAPILIDGKLRKRRKGVPQGSPLSPLLSNIILHELDKFLEKNKIRYVRYADDFSIYVKTPYLAQRAAKAITLFLEGKLKLIINREKSGIRKPEEFEILGYTLVPSYKKGEKGKHRLTVSEKSWNRLKENLKSITRKTAPTSFDKRIQELKAVYRGWLNYFRLGSIYSKLRDLDGWLRNRLRYCIWHDWKKPERKRKNLIRLGVPTGQAYAWSRSRMGGWAVAQSPILVTTITLERLRKRGYETMLDYYLKVAPQFNEPLYREMSTRVRHFRAKPLRTVV
jgi:group II intron reverse transcriptase/maturase